MKFTDLSTAKKGRKGELLVRAYLKTRNVVIYEPDIGPHPCDFIIYSRKEGAFFHVDAKTYPRRYSRPETGIDLADWIKYQQLSEAAQTVFYLIFVDVFEGKMYGATIDRLVDTAHAEGDKIYFPLSRFTELKTLTREELEQLPGIKNAERYSRVKRYF